MDMNTLHFFDSMPEALPIYEAFLQAVLARWPDVDIAVQKTQIRFKNRFGFAWASLPIRRRKDWPDICLIVTFGLDHEIVDPRIAVATEPFPRRWTHHVVLARPEEVDDQLMEWVKASYDFSMEK